MLSRSEVGIITRQIIKGNFNELRKWWNQSDTGALNNGPLNKALKVKQYINATKSRNKITIEVRINNKNLLN